jgi:predicted transcriptional regulator
MNNPKYKMFPIRIEWELANQLEQFIMDTRTTKTQFATSAIAKMLDEFNRSGVRQTIKDIYMV